MTMQKNRAVSSRGAGHHVFDPHLFILRVEPDDLKKDDNKSPFRWVMSRGRPVEKKADEDEFEVLFMEIALGGK